MDVPSVQVELEAPAAVGPGAAFSVAARVRAPAGWHVYWGENAGETGLATTATLRGAPAPRWTAPARRVDAGDIVSFVYDPEGAAVWTLVAPLAGAVELVADVAWLACRSVCVPGATAVVHTVSVRERARAPTDLERLLPAPAPAWVDPEGRLRVCLPAGLELFPNRSFEALGVRPAHDGRAWTATLPAGAPDDAALVFTEPGRPERAWRAELARARVAPSCP